VMRTYAPLQYKQTQPAGNLQGGGQEERKSRERLGRGGDAKKKLKELTFGGTPITGGVGGWEDRQKEKQRTGVKAESSSRCEISRRETSDPRCRREGNETWKEYPKESVGDLRQEGALTK